MENTEKSIGAFKGTKGDWKQSKLFEKPIFCKNKKGAEWYHNEIKLQDQSNRIICTVAYATDTENQGWGQNETIEKWESNAKLIAAAPDLLEALTLLVSSITDTRSEGQLGKELDKAEAAIKKATS